MQHSKPEPSRCTRRILTASGRPRRGPGPGRGGGGHVDAREHRRGEPRSTTRSAEMASGRAAAFRRGQRRLPAGSWPSTGPWFGAARFAVAARCSNARAEPALRSRLVAQLGQRVVGPRAAGPARGRPRGPVQPEQRPSPAPRPAVGDVPQPARGGEGRGSRPGRFGGESRRPEQHRPLAVRPGRDPVRPVPGAGGADASRVVPGGRGRPRRRAVPGGQVPGDGRGPGEPARRHAPRPVRRGGGRRASPGGAGVPRVATRVPRWWSCPAPGWPWAASR